MDYQYSDVAKMIDHSLLTPYLTRTELEAGCKLALAYDVASVCILPYALPRCVELLRGSQVRASTTIGFPHGGHATSVKIYEAEQALSQGCQELDMVVNISLVLSDAWGEVEREIRAIIEIAHAAGQKVKVIFENCYLQDRHKIELCRICSDLHVDWIKTSTGYGSSGATREDIALMRKHTETHVQVKAAGGIRDLDTILDMRTLGATRCGASRTANILDECRVRLGLPPIARSHATSSGTY